MPDKWDKYADKPDRWSQYATEETPDSTLNTKGKGTGSTAPKGSAAKRFTSSAYTALAEPVKGMYRGVTAGPQNPEEAAIEASNPYAGRAALVFNRFITDPMKSEARRTAEEFRQSDPWSLRPSEEAKRHRELALAHGVATVVPMIGPGAVAAGEKIGEQGKSGDVAGAWGTLTGTVLPFAVPEAAGRGYRAVRSLGVERYSPRPVKVAGITVPMAVGEADPLSRAGRLETRLKQSGIGAERFEKLEHTQQVLVKRAIRNVAAMASETEAVQLPADPQAAMKDAAEIVFNRARPMYTAMDSALRTTPASFGEVTPIVKNSIERARKLGVVIEPEAAEVIMDGKKITRAEHPELWRRLADQGIINEQGQGTPLNAFVKVRSQMLKMQKASADPAMRYAIGHEVRIMNDAIEDALKNTPHFDNWQEANRLWSKAYALREVADAVRRATKGTPSSVQASELSRVAPKLQASTLVNRLNQLAENGILEKAFSVEEAQNLRAAADVLDRIQKTKVGKGPGEHMSFSRGLSHALRGAAAPAIGAGAGALLGGLHGAEIGAGLGLAVKWIGERGLVRIMTRPDGLAALRTLEAAKTPGQMQAAMKALTAAAAISAGRAPTLKELNSEADKRKPALAGATY